MRRRDFLIGLGFSLAGAGRVRAQQKKIWRVAYLASGTDEQVDFFRKRMAELGYTQGDNLIIEVRAADGEFARLPAFASELLAFRPDLIVAEATPAIAAVHKLTSTIPIVMSSVTTPLEAGFVRSFAHPGGNITGVVNMFGDLTAKSFDILHLALPAARTIGILMSSNPTHKQTFELAKSGAAALGLTTVAFMAATPVDLDRTFDEIKQAKCDALYVLADPIRHRIPELAISAHIPAVFQYGRYVELGGLMSYGPDILAVIAHSADFVDKILKGANPADLPLEQPTKFEFVINLKTAKTLGLTIPESVLLLADRVVE